jgi:hypothetical protein
MNPDTRPPIKSAWPTPIGKPLTNRAISRYKKLGYYASNLTSATERVKQSKQKRLSAFISEFV